MNQSNFKALSVVEVTKLRLASVNVNEVNVAFMYLFHHKFFTYGLAPSALFLLHFFDCFWGNLQSRFFLAECHYLRKLFCF